MPFWSGGSYSGPKEIKYLFIDGGCLREIFKAFSDEFLDGRDVTPDFERIKGNYSKVFYYDAIYVQKNGEPDSEYKSRIEPIVSELQKIRMLDGYHVYEGDVRRRGKRGNEQKKVDVMIAVDMLTHSFRKNMHQASLLTNDLDFKPLLDALVLQGMNVELIYQDGRVNDDLISAADKKSPLDPRTLMHWVKNMSAEDLLQFRPKQVNNQKMKQNELIWEKLDSKGRTWQLFQEDVFYNLQCLNAHNNNRYVLNDLDRLTKWVCKVENIEF